LCALPLQATFFVFRDRQVKAAGHCGGLQQAYCCVLWALGSSGRDIEKCADLCQRSRFLASTGVDKSCQLRTGGRMAVSRRWSVGSVLKRAVVLMGDKVQFGSFAEMLGRGMRGRVDCCACHCCLFAGHRCWCKGERWSSWRREFVAGERPRPGLSWRESTTVSGVLIRRVLFPLSFSAGDEGFLRARRPLCVATCACCTCTGAHVGVCGAHVGVCVNPTVSGLRASA